MVAEGIQEAVQNSILPYEARNYSYTISLGIADNHPCDISKYFEAILSLVNHKLYQAKTKGRNCTILYQAGSSCYLTF